MPQSLLLWVHSFVPIPSILSVFKFYIPLDFAIAALFIQSAIALFFDAIFCCVMNIRGIIVMNYTQNSKLSDIFDENYANIHYIMLSIMQGRF